jgi:hypothetical protein
MSVFFLFFSFFLQSKVRWYVGYVGNVLLGTTWPQGVPSYFLHTRAFGTYLLGGGVIYLPKKIIRWWYFTCKKPENIICHGILHVNMFHYFKIPYFICTFFIKFYLQWIYWTLFFIARCSTILASELPEDLTRNMAENESGNELNLRWH